MTTTEDTSQPALTTRLQQLLDQHCTTATATMTETDWADDEITAAADRTPSMGDVLYHAFALLRPRNLGQGFATEFVFRAHARELLQRVAEQADTRPATAAEICLALTFVSAKIPLHGVPAGLYGRMWDAAFPDIPTTAELAQRQAPYEQLYGSQLDDLEQQLRAMLADQSRAMGAVTCTGFHHRTPVSCRFARRID